MSRHHDTAIRFTVLALLLRAVLVRTAWPGRGNDLIPLGPGMHENLTSLISELLFLMVPRDVKDLLRAKQSAASSTLILASCQLAEYSYKNQCYTIHDVKIGGAQLSFNLSHSLQFWHCGDSETLLDIDSMPFLFTRKTAIRG